MPRFLVLSVIAVTTVVCGWHARAADEPKPDAKERFDLLVRDDLFAGFNGDATALAKGMKACDAALAKNPKHAEALV